MDLGALEVLRKFPRGLSWKVNVAKQHHIGAPGLYPLPVCYSMGSYILDLSLNSIYLKKDLFCCLKGLNEYTVDHADGQRLGM